MRAVEVIALLLFGSRVLIADADGHVSWYNSACARDREAAYLLAARLPTTLRR